MNLGRLAGTAEEDAIVFIERIFVLEKEKTNSDWYLKL